MQDMKTDRQTGERNTSEREKNKDKEIDEIAVETEREERDSKIFPDFGRMCGKREKENPLINRQLQHVELDLSQGVIFLFSCSASFLPW